MGRDSLARLQRNPVVAAVSDLSRLGAVIRSPSEVVFLLRGSILTLPEAVQEVQAAGKAVFLHLDLIEGFSRDSVALEYIKQEIRPEGVITTRANLVKQAAAAGLEAVQRVFMLDSLSLETAIKSLKATRPHAVELLPGIVPRVVERVGRETRLPVIAGGLIESKEDVIAALKAGALGISTTKEDLWYI